MEIAHVLTWDRLQLSALLFLCVFFYVFSGGGWLTEKGENHESLYCESEQGLYMPWKRSARMYDLKLIQLLPLTWGEGVAA